MYSAYKLNTQGDNIQPWRTPFPIWNQSVVPCPVLTIASWPAYRFLKRQVRWSGIPVSLRIFQFVVAHTVTGFKAEAVNTAVDAFLELSCFFDDPTNVGNLISGSSAFSKSSLNIWKVTVHKLLKPGLENFEHYLLCYEQKCQGDEQDYIAKLFEVSFKMYGSNVALKGIKYKCISLNFKHLQSASHPSLWGPHEGPVCTVSFTVNVKTANARENEMIHMLNRVKNNMLLEHRKRQARSGGNQSYRQSLEKRLKCSVCHRWWDQSHIFLLRQLGYRQTADVRAKLLQSRLILCDPVNCSPPGSSVHGILQARVLEWVAMPSSKGSSWPRDWTRDSWCSFIKESSFSAESAVTLTRPLWNPSGAALPFWDAAAARHVLTSQMLVRETCSTQPWAQCGIRVFICSGLCWGSNPNTLVFGDGVFGR